MSILVIVESPAKANTIKGYLGQNYKVIASKGHIRDLPKSTLGIDVDNGFEPHYINIRGKGDVIKELKREAKTASKIFLATDLTVRERLYPGTLQTSSVFRLIRRAVLPLTR